MEVYRNHPRAPRARERRAGMAFGAMMMAIFVVFCTTLVGAFTLQSKIGSGFLSFANNTRTAVGATTGEAIAYNLAESGQAYAMEWLVHQATPPTNLSNPGYPFAPALWNGVSSGTSPAREKVVMNVSSSSDQGYFTVLMYPDQGNSNSTQKRYLIESIGVYNGVQQIVDSWVSQISFGKYAYFTDTDPGNGVWQTGKAYFNGPVHTNASNSNRRLMSWNSTGTVAPMFNYNGPGAYSTSGSNISWSKDGSGNIAPSSASDWSHVAVGGSTTVETNVPTVPMPTTSATQAAAALGTGTAPTGSAPAVLIPKAGNTTAGGIYIHGQVDEIAMSVGTPATTQIIEIDQTDTTTSPSTADKTYVTINPVTNTTSYYSTTKQGAGTLQTSSTKSLTGVTNGVVYADSNIGHQETTGDAHYDAYTDTVQAHDSANANHGQDKTGGVHGVIADNYYNGTTEVRQSGITIATSISANVNLDGSITTNTPSTSGSFGTNAGTFGLVGNTIEIDNNDYTGAALTNITIMGSIMAYNTIDAANLNNRGTGAMNIYGSYIAQKSGYFYIISGSTLLNGFSQSFNYDARLANTPPPFFPTTGNYQTLSWKRVTSVVS